jgi:integrase
MDSPLRRLGDHRQTCQALAGASLSQAADRLQAAKVASRRWVPGTAATFSRAMAQGLEVLGDRPAASLTVEDLERLFVVLSSRGYSPQWLDLVRRRWGQLCRYLVRHEILVRDPSSVWEPPQIGEDEHQRVFRHFSRPEIERLAAAARSLAVRHFVWAACYTGLRRANLYAMIWDWIDPGWVLEIPGRAFKQRRPHRVPIHPVLQELLGPRGAPGDPVIPGLPHPCSIGRALKAAARRVGIPTAWVYPHNFRRTTCSWLKAAGVTREEAMTFLGTSSQNVLIRHYWPQAEDSERWSIVRKIP